MEGYFRLAAPLLYFTFITIALCMLLGGNYNRRGQTLRIAIAVAAVLLVQVSMLGAKGVGEKIPEMAAALFMIPITTTLIFFLALASAKPKQRRRHPVTEERRER